MRKTLIATLLFSFLAAGVAGAHELHQKVSRGSAVIIELTHADHSPFSDRQFEVVRDGEETPFQTGRTDALGRIVFVPDRDGAWRIRAFSDDGHGLDITIEAGPRAENGAEEAAGRDRPVRMVLGVILIVAIFMVLLIFVRRNR